MSSERENNSSPAEGDLSEQKAKPLVEGVDYYLENDLLVFTSSFLKKRGYCCESGCRHCPYGYQKETG